MRVFTRLFCTIALLSASVLHAQIIHTIAGTPDSSGYAGDGGAAIAAQIGSPAGVAIDAAGNLYITDNLNSVVRKVSPDGTITTITGSGTGGYSGDGAAATDALISLPQGITVDDIGNVYIADNGNFRVRMIDSSGIIHTIAGNGVPSATGTAGDGAPATSAPILAYGVGIDQFQNVYVADGNSAIRKITNSTGIISTVAGSSLEGFSGDGGAATDAALNNPTGIAVDRLTAQLYIADYSNNRVRWVNTSAVINTLAGTGTGGFSGDGGSAVDARINHPFSVGLDARRNVYIADNFNNRVRKVDSTGNIYTVAGNGSGSFCGDGGPASSACLNNPVAVCVNSEGSIFIADQSNNVIREVSKPAIVTISAQPGTSICNGDAVSFTANVTNKVIGEKYQWVYNGVDTGTNSPTFSLDSANNGDQIYCIVYFGTASNVLAYSDTITMTVNTVVVPFISITADTNNICKTMPDTFRPLVLNGGSSALLEWQVNGVVRGTGPIFSYEPNNTDLVNCVLISSHVCARPDTVTSNGVRMDVNPNVTLSLSIMTPFGDTVARGEEATFVAQPTNEGSDPQYQWFVNGSAVPGATSNVFNSDSLSGTDTVFCVLTGSLYCTYPLTDTSAPVVMNISDLSVSQVSAEGLDLILMPNPNKGTFKLSGTITRDAAINVVNILGQCVYTNIIHSAQGKISENITLPEGLPDGMYLVHIANTTLPFVIKH